MIASQVVRGRVVPRGMKELTSVPIAETRLKIYEQSLIADSRLFSETISRAEAPIITN